MLHVASVVPSSSSSSFLFFWGGGALTLCFLFHLRKLTTISAKIIFRF